MSRLEAIRQRLEGRSIGAHVAYESEFGCGGYLLSLPGDEEFFAWAGDDVPVLLAVVEAATHATDGRTEATLTASDIRVWAAQVGSGASRNWMLGIADALAALEGD